MLIELSAATRKRLLQDGYSLAKEFTPVDDLLEHVNIGVPHIWPDDPPEQKNRIILVPLDTRQVEEWFITSTRAITIARELPGGNMVDRYGIVCAEDDRGRSQFVLGGGKVQPDFDGTSADRLLHGEDRELVRGAVVAENREELNITFSAEDRGSYKSYFMFGIRGITDRITDPATGRFETVLKKEGKLSVGDACFLAISHERLANFEGQRGETRARHVKPASELLRELSREERMRNVKPMLPYAQATALALAIETAKEIFGNDMPPALVEVILDGEEAAKRVLQRNSYARYFIKVIQEGPWEV
ncbi:MAG TPA: hypothetical protein VJJ02_02450 [Candidatus Paceibacterota bacterium]